MKTLTVRNALRFVVLGSLALAPLAALAEVPHTPTTIFDDNGKMFHVFPVRLGDLPPLVEASGLQAIIDGSSAANPSGQAAGPGQFSNKLRYHGGPVILKAQEKSLWWGTNFDADAQPHVADFFRQFGTSQEYVTITQYYNQAGTKISTNALGGNNYFDTTTPPSTVTDADCQQEIKNNFANGNLGTPDPNTVYFLFLANGVTSTSGGSSSCVNYCGYHGNFNYNGTDIKYAVMPYPSCGGCQGAAQAGLSIAAASLTIISSHEMREAATDEDLNAWYDLFGQEADDKCAWQLFVDNNFQYQKEWSNAKNGCVMKGLLGP